MTDSSFNSDCGTATESDPRKLLTDGGTGKGLVTIESDATVSDSVQRVKEVLEEKDAIRLMAEIDHEANAATVDRDLRPTTVLVFGNPDVGTPLMQSAPSLAIDLPMKLLVMEADDGTVTVSYNDPAYLADRHDLTGEDERLETAADALSTLAAVAAGKA